MIFQGVKLKIGDKLNCRMDYENLDGGIVIDEIKIVTTVKKKYVIVDGWCRFNDDGWSDCKTCKILNVVLD